MKRIRKYLFITSPILLGVIMVLFYISALYLPYENSERWIPALIGIVDFDSISKQLSVILATIFLLLSTISLYSFNVQNMMIGRSFFLLPIIYLIFSLSTPSTLYFSGVSVASLFVIWSVYYSIFSKRGDKDLFISGFLISVAALFDPHIILLIPLIIFYSLRSSVVSLRTITIVIASIIIPFAFMFSFRYLFFQDAIFFGEIYLTDLSAIKYPSISLRNIAEIILALFFVIYISLAILNAVRNINRYKILKSNSFSRFISMLIFTGLIILLYPESGEGLIQIFSIPASVIVVEYISATEKPARKRAGYLLILIFLAMSRIAGFF